MEKVYTVKQTAEVLNVGKKAVYELISQNKLKAARVGRSLRVPEECINEYMNIVVNKQKSLRELELEMEIDVLKKENEFLKQITINILSEVLKAIPLNK